MTATSTTPTQKARVAKHSAKPKRPTIEALENPFTRSCLELLEGAADQEAIGILVTKGIFTGDDAGAVTDPVARLGDTKEARARERKRDVLERQLEALSDEAYKVYLKLEHLFGDELAATIDVSFVLGVATGRRLGAQPFSVRG